MPDLPAALLHTSPLMFFTFRSLGPDSLAATPWWATHGTPCNGCARSTSAPARALPAQAPSSGLRRNKWRSAGA